MADDAENTVIEPVAPGNDSAQSEQGASPAPEDSSPETPTDTEPLLAGKYKSVEDLESGYKELERHLGERQTTYQPVQPQGYPTYPPLPPLPQAPAFDPETQAALDEALDRKLEERKAIEFARKHAKELEDPILDGAVRRIISDSNLRGQRVDQEEALSQAKEMLEKRLNPQVNKAEAQGFEEGQEVARKKQQASAVGDTGSKSVPKEDDELSAAEFAAKYNLVRR